MGKRADKDLAKIQHVYVTPLSHLMELDTEGHEISHTEALSAANAVTELHNWESKWQN